jgi:hypothetical protein
MKSWQKQYDRTTLRGIKERQGLREHHIKCTNWRWERKHNGKYETSTNALNPQLWCINHIMEEASLTRFMTSPYNTRAHEQLVYSRKENRERYIATRMNRERPQISPKSFEPRKCSTVITMAPPKPAEPGQTTRPTMVQTRSRGPLEENEQKQPEIIDINEIPSLEEILVNPTLILEEIQQPQAGTMKEDTPAETREPQNEEAETQREVKLESTQAAVEVNGMTQNLGVAVQPDESQAPNLGQPIEDTTGTTSAWPEWLMGKQSKVVGISN